MAVGSAAARRFAKRPDHPARRRSPCGFATAPVEALAYSGIPGHSATLGNHVHVLFSLPALAMLRASEGEIEHEGAIPQRGHRSRDSGGFTRRGRPCRSSWTDGRLVFTRAASGLMQVGDTRPRFDQRFGNVLTILKSLHANIEIRRISESGHLPRLRLASHRSMRIARTGVVLSNLA